MSLYVEMLSTITGKGGRRQGLSIKLLRVRLSEERSLVSSQMIHQNSYVTYVSLLILKDQMSMSL